MLRSNRQNTGQSTGKANRRVDRVVDRAWPFDTGGTFLGEDCLIWRVLVVCKMSIPGGFRQVSGSAVAKDRNAWKDGAVPLVPYPPPKS